MPLYEYHCKECDYDFTLLHPATVNKEETACPECGSSQVEHKFSTFSSKIQGVSAASKRGPVTQDELPNKDILKLPLPRLRSEL